MFVLFETPAGFALFRVLDEGKLQLSPDELHKKFSTLEKAKQVVSLKEFQKFGTMTEALAATSALLEGTIDKSLENFIQNSVVQKGVQQRLAVMDKTLGKAISDKFNVDVVNNNNVMELFRCIRSQLEGLLSNNMAAEDLNQMTLGLSHSLGRYKLKFSPDKVDVMIVQAIGLMDDLDKEINNYAMRVKEWYGWHFPELAKLVVENVQYARIVKLLKQRSKIREIDLTDILDEQTAGIVTKAAALSMGTDVTDEDIEHLVELADQVIELFQYREELGEYIKNRMFAIAPNLTVLVGELIGARLIAHAGSLLNLAKQASSTVQILGAEKALFRALKAKAATPKYGVIFHASIVGQATAKNKGKMARILANKASLGCRVDALGDETTKKTIGVESLAKITATMVTLEGKTIVAPTAKPSTSYERPKQYEVMEEKKKVYKESADVTIGEEKKEKKDKKDKKDKKEKKDKKRKREDEKEGSSSKKVKGE